MEQSQSGKIRYTVKYFSSAPASVLAKHPFHTVWQNEPPLELQHARSEDGANPIVEIITEVEGLNSGGIIGTSSRKLDTLKATNIRGTHMIIHSETLSRTIRDVVKFYPGQNLTGTGLIVHEPYACLMHHMSDLEHLIALDRDPTELEHVQVLLEFLRPQYQQQYIPAEKRSLAAQPTVKFDDLWAIIKPGSLAYVDWDRHRIGCMIGKSIYLPPKPSHGLPERWSVDFWFLQVHWPSDQIGCVSHTVAIDRFDGEKPITSLPIHPAEFLDVTDQGKTKQRFTDRSRKVCEILWGESMYMEYDGECMDHAKQSYTGRIIVGGSHGIEELYPKHNWKFNFVPPSEVMKKDADIPLSEIELMVNPKRDHREILTVDHLFILSPFLSAFRLLNNDWVPITVENIRPLPEHHDIPSPIMPESKLKMIQALVGSQDCEDGRRPLLSNTQGNGVIILLHGSPGVGKSYTVEYVSLTSRRPLLALGASELGTSPDTLATNLARWFSLGKAWNAIILIDNCEEFGERLNAENGRLSTVFNRALQLFEGTLFLTTSRIGKIDEGIHYCVSLTVLLPSLDRKACGLIWQNLERKLDAEKGIRLHRNATRFLHSAEVRAVDWNGKEINHCFKAAIALATAQAKRSKKGLVEVEVGHFKEAMNLVHEHRQYNMELFQGREPSHRARQMGWRDDSFRPKERRPRSLDSDSDSNSNSDSDSDSSASPSKEKLSKIDDIKISSPVSISTNQAKPLLVTTKQSVTLNSDSDLCIPDLNRSEWDVFRAASAKELFRKTKFYAIDVLEGEPLIKLHIDNQKRRKRQNLTHKGVSSGSTIAQPSGQDGRALSALEPSKTVLPERIRINSPAIIKAFAEIHGDSSISGPFLLFRPFRSLLYYEQEFRDMINQQENTLREWSTRNTQMPTDEEGVDDETERRNLSAGLEQMKCLISFIENEIKKKQEYLMSCRCQTVPFADIPLLFSPGDTVIAKDREQAYRVTRVSSTRHRVKNRKETSPDFWKDENTVELEDSPAFVHCTYLDFDGKLIGPVSRIFTIPRYDGQKMVTSLPIFPLQYAEDDGLRERLVKRGKEFFKVAGVKHMHYTGLTLMTRDEIDSQVVIDFEEAISRYPDWKPPIQSVLEESFKKVVGFSDEPDENADLRNFIKAQRSMDQPCIEECCANEPRHHDEYVEDRRREDYIVSQMSKEISATPSVTIIPRAFHDIMENNTLTDDEYLIMSYRVFGFVLRNRKWHELDMTHVFEVSTLGAGEGFDELVLPPGHGDMVKSMIRQHLRDRKLSSVNRDKTDIVRGKECVADLFRRPLFQITSGDLGTTAREVEDALEENFSLASRWNSILLIDEADVFLAERTKEDFVRNSLVAVFLRMMEYYAGVLFLTTNRVGVFDEAFTSRIHISLYYPPLDRISTLQIFEKNWDRINTRYKSAGRVIEIKVPEITDFAIDYFENNKEGRWNGRQIRNAFQSALALAELDALGTDDFLAESDHNRPVVLGRKSFDTVAEAYKGFTNYLKQVYGADFARRARENLWRYDAFGSPRMPNSLNTRLKIAEPAMPPPAGQWTEQSHPGHGHGNPRPYYPPQHQYAERYDRPSQRSEYPPTPEQRQHHDPRERWDSRSGGEGFGR